MHELLLAAAHQVNPADRERMVGEAISPALGIAGWLQLAVLVSHLAQSSDQLMHVVLY